MNTAKSFDLLVIAAVAAAGCAMTSPVLAQDSTSSSRAEVKAETRAALKAHQILPAGEAAAVPETPFRSNKTRAQRKAETVVARKTGQLLPAGEIGLKPAPFHSEKTRAQRKGETLAAAKAKKLIPAGESIDPSTK